MSLPNSNSWHMLSCNNCSWSLLIIIVEICHLQVICFRAYVYEISKSHYEKKWCFATSLVTEFSNCIWTLASHHIYMLWVLLDKLQKLQSYKNCNLLYIWCNSLQLNYKFVTTIPFQLLYNSLMITIIMSCWRHFSSTHQNLTRGTIRTFCDFFEILISIIHYDYLF
jgi:hypothetical protein